MKKISPNDLPTKLPLRDAPHLYHEGFENRMMRTLKTKEQDNRTSFAGSINLNPWAWWAGGLAAACLCFVLVWTVFIQPQNTPNALTSSLLNNDPAVAVQVPETLVRTQENVDTNLKASNDGFLEDEFAMNDLENELALLEEPF